MAVRASWALAAPASSGLDIRDPLAVEEYVERIRPDLIVNASAYNFVEQAESDAATAMAVNAEGPRHAARAAARTGARLIHISTDYVFDGLAFEPYGEDAAANPINVYGLSKLAGERAVLEASSQYTFSPIVLRTAWLYSEYGGNFVKTMLRLAARKQPMHVVDDQFGTPTYAGDLADAIIQLAGLPSVPGGIYHYAGSEAMSWHGFAQRIFQAAGLRPDLSAIASSAYPSRAARPKNSALSSTKIARHGIHAKPLQPGLDYVIGWL